MIKQFLKTKKTGKILIFSIVFICLSFLIFFGVNLDKYANLQLGREAVAAGGFPYQIGLTNVRITKCQVTLGVCVGVGVDAGPATALCNTKSPGVCESYRYVSGVPAGGMGTAALFLFPNLSFAGVSTGGQLIAGGMGPTMMDGGVVAGPGGCVGSGCARVEDENLWKKTKLAFKYVIATTKNSIGF